MWAQLQAGVGRRVLRDEDLIHAHLDDNIVFRLQLDPPLYPISSVMASERVGYSALGKKTDGNLARVHMGEMTFRAVVGVDANG